MLDTPFDGYILLRIGRQLVSSGISKQHQPSQTWDRYDRVEVCCSALVKDN
jgi:hypothetical protein